MTLGSLFKTPTPSPQQQEDPAVKAMREREQKRAEEERIKATQDQLKAETQFRSPGLGVASLRGGLAGRRALKSILGSG